MLVIATKRQFIVGAALALVLSIGLNISNYIDTIPKGDLTTIDGVLKTEKIWKNAITKFVGKERTGICSFSRCKSKDVSLIEGERITVLMDSKGNIFEISLNNKIILGRNDIRDEQIGILLISAMWLVLLLCCLFLLMKEKNVS